MNEVNANEQCWEGQDKEAESHHGFLCLIAFFSDENSDELNALKDDQQYNLTAKINFIVTELVSFKEKEK